MSAVPQVRKTGPRTYTPDEPILGGQIVEARPGTSRIGVAGAGSFAVLGVALTDASAPEDVLTTPTVINGRPVLNAAVLPTVVGVADSGIEVPVTYAADADFGDKLIAASAGRATPAGANPDARTIVGTCTAPDGVLAGNVGLMRTV